MSSFQQWSQVACFSRGRGGQRCRADFSGGVTSRGAVPRPDLPHYPVSAPQKWGPQPANGMVRTFYRLVERNPSAVKYLFIAQKLNIKRPTFWGEIHVYIIGLLSRPPFLRLCPRRRYLSKLVCFEPVAWWTASQCAFVKKPFSAEMRVPSSGEKQCAGVISLA